MSLIPIIIDSSSIIKDMYNRHLICRQGWNTFVLKKNYNQNFLSPHTSIVAKTFTQLNYGCIIYTTNIVNQTLEDLFTFFLQNHVQNPIYCPFGLRTISKKLSNILDKFLPGQVICSFPNRGQYDLMGLVTHSNTTVVASSKNKDILKKLKNYKITNLYIVKSKKSNSLLLAYYHFLKHKYNNKGTLIMPKQLFENNGKYSVQPNELFVYQLFEGLDLPEIEVTSLPDGVFFEDGFIYGKTAEEFILNFIYENTEYTLHFDINEEEIMQEFMPIGIDFGGGGSPGPDFPSFFPSPLPGGEGPIKEGGLS